MVVVFYAWFVIAWFTQKWVYQKNFSNSEYNNLPFTTFSSFLVVLLAGVVVLPIGILIAPRVTLGVAIGFAWWIICFLLIFAQPIFYPTIVIYSSASANDSEDDFIPGVITGAIFLGVVILAITSIATSSSNGMQNTQVIITTPSPTIQITETSEAP